MKGHGGCFICGGGHLARDCRKGGKGSGKGKAKSSTSGKGGSKGLGCWTCGETSHVARDCPNGQGRGGGRICRNFSSTGVCRFGDGCRFQHEGTAQAPVEAEPARAVSIVVNGLSGPRCTIEATTAWTVLQVKEAIKEKIDIAVASQKLLKGTEQLSQQVTVGSLTSGEPPATLELSLVVQLPRPVEFVGMSNGLEQVEPGHLRKTKGSDWSSTATAVSSESLVVGQGPGLRFRPSTTHKDFFIGLGSRSSAPASHREIDYAAWCGSEGRFYVYESGDLKVAGGRYAQSAEVVLVVHGDRVDFLIDGELKFTSQLRGEAELYAMACFFAEGAEAMEIQWL